MKALCVKQPWAELIACGRKNWEMRTWSTNYRGPILILASGQPSRSDEAKEAVDCHLDDGSDLSLGCTIAIANLREILVIKHRGYSGNARCHVERGEFAWVLEGVKRVPHVSVKGRLGLFEAAAPWLRKLLHHPDTSTDAKYRLLMDRL